jgi:hypothetical protein
MRARVYATLIVGSLAILSAQAAPARADQRQDWMVDAPKDGSFVNLDFVFGAIQGSFEQRIPVYGKANQLILRGGAIAALPFGSSQADVDLRIVNLTLGTSIGYADVWRNQTFQLGEPMNRKERREREAAGEFNSDKFGFWEGRASIAFPFNDYIVFNQVNAIRVSGAHDRSFDNWSGVIDDGETFKSDFQLFFKHNRIGALAPTFQILNFSLNHDWHTQFNYGFILVTRAGLVQRDDLFLLQMLFTSGPIFGKGFDNRDNYGSAPFRGPYTFLIVYRSVIQL